MSVDHLDRASDRIAFEIVSFGDPLNPERCVDGWSTVCVGGGIETIRAKNGSELWGLFEGDTYYHVVGKELPNTWHHVSKHPSRVPDSIKCRCMRY